MYIPGLRIHPDPVIRAFEFLSSDSSFQILGAQALEFGLTMKAQRACKSFILNVFTKEGSACSPGSASGNSLLVNGLTELEKFGVENTARAKVMECILDCWVLSDVLLEQKRCMKTNLRRIGRIREQAVDYSQNSLIDSVYDIYLSIPKLVYLEWEQVSNLVVLSEWDQDIAKRMSWSRDEFVFYIAETYNRIIDCHYWAGYCRRLIKEFGRESIVDLVLLWCGKELLDSFLKVVDVELCRGASREDG